MLIKRVITNTIKKNMAKEPKVFVIYGPRQSGKTTLLNEIIKGEKRKVLFLKGEDLLVQKTFSESIFENLNSFIGGTEILVIDEAQKIDNIGESIKLLFDTRPMLIFLSGSSSFDLANRLAEPMTGRTRTYTLYPLAMVEIPLRLPNPGLKSKLEDFFRFGLYPKIQALISQKEKEEYLYEVLNTYLYNDLLSFKEIKKPRKILDLLTLLAYQIGCEVNTAELSQELNLDRPTVDKYLDILEKMFVVVNLRGFSRNLRKEVTKTSKYYFIDLGLRNALIRNFNPLKYRNDVGSMFENFCFIERLKFLRNNRKFVNHYFWRTYDQKEIDLIEEKGGKLSGFEFKYGLGKVPKATKKEFLETYPESEFKIITPENLEKFLTEMR